MLQVMKVLVLSLCVVLLTSCASRGQPSNVTNLCAIFKEKPKWYHSAKDSAAKWGGPIHVPMAIIYQESTFNRNARPKMNYFLGIIPTGRKSNAFGYSQALKSTWAEYEQAVRSRAPERNNFKHAIDFVFWFMSKTQQRNNVSKWDAYSQYLNYHEGQGGYSRGTHLSKQWLLNTAKRVEARSKQYASQLANCQAELDTMKRGWLW